MRRALFSLVCCSIVAFAQSSSTQSLRIPAASARTPVPALVPFEGVSADAQGKPVGHSAAITFQIFKDEQGGEPLWQETQTAALDESGRYKVQLGASSPSGIPVGLFGAGEARWLEVQVAGRRPQARVLLSSVPYAMKAADAETLAGRAAGDYLTREDLQLAAPTAQAAATAHPDADPTVTGTGTAGYVPVWTGASTIGNSVLSVSGANVGIGTAHPVYPLDVNGAETVRGLLKLEQGALATASAPVPSTALEFQSQTFSSATKASVPQYFIWQAAPTGNNTANPAANFALSTSSGSASPKLTGFSFNPAGLVNFAPGQTFPGTVASVTAASPLVATTASGAVKLTLDPVALGSTLNANYAQLGAANTFSQTQTIMQGLNVTGAVNSTTGYQIGGNPFETGNLAQQNVSLGFSSSPSANGTSNLGIGPNALASLTSGTNNIAMGVQAMYANLGGGDNLGIGYFALSDNTGGSFNTALGYQAMEFNQNGLENTALGYAAGQTNNGVQQNGSGNTYIGAFAGPGTTTEFDNSTAIGVNATVSESGALVLGGVGVNAVKVGIGTATPYTDYALDVESTYTAGIDSGVVVNAAGGNLYLGMTSGAHKYRVDTNGNVFATKYLTGGADFAESVAVQGRRSKYEPGDLMVIDARGNRRLVLADKPYSTRVAGIYSTKPGMLASPHTMDDPRPETTEVPLAVVGIVPCKVTAENGPIEAGDLLVSSSRPGYAMKGTRRSLMLGAVVGKAMQPLDSGTGLIEVLVTLQ
jgi:hypothetical protein